MYVYCITRRALQPSPAATAATLPPPQAASEAAPTDEAEAGGAILAFFGTQSSRRDCVRASIKQQQGQGRTLEDLLAR